MNEHKRVVLPPKSRLGTKLDTNSAGIKKRSIKERLGPIFNAEKQNCKIYELEDVDTSVDYISEQDEISQEEKKLREGAIKTLDLRNRLSKKEMCFSANTLRSSMCSQEKCKPQMEGGTKETSSLMITDSEDNNHDENNTGVRTFVKKSKKSKLKKEKKKKEKRKEHKVSKLKPKKVKTAKQKRKKDAKKLHSKHKTEDLETSKISLAAKVADEREGELFSQNVRKSNDAENSSLEIYMQKMKEKKRKKLHQTAKKKGESSNLSLGNNSFDEKDKTLETRQHKFVPDDNTRTIELKKTESQPSTKSSIKPVNNESVKRVLWVRITSDTCFSLY